MTVPAYFNETQRVAIREAEEYSRLNFVDIISEPTAVATYYASHKMRGKLLILDLGGATFDITTANIDENEHVQVQPLTGNTQLGGSDFDHALFAHVLDLVQEELG